MSEVTLWQIVGVLGLWVGLAVLQTSLGRNDKKAWPISWGQTFIGWLIVAAPPMMVFAFFWLAKNSLPLLVVIFSGLLWAAGWKYGQQLPLVGRWIGALQAREVERADKGLL